MASFLASRIINEKLTYQEVPESLKKDVAKILEDAPENIVEEKENEPKPIILEEQI